MKRTIVLTSLLLIILTLNGCMGGGGQTGNLAGKIYEKGTENLVTEKIVVVQVGTKELPVTDGQYSFSKLLVGKQTLKAEAIGYKQYSEAVTITSGNTTKDIYLEKMEDPEVKVTDVSLDKVSINLVEGSSYPLVATIIPANATNQNITWSSSRDDIAKVDQNGKVQALKAGTATITVKTEDGGHEANCAVTVTAL